MVTRHIRLRPRILLIVAPSKMECHRAAKSFGLSFLRVEMMRFISNAYHLRGWSAGTPFITSERASWSTRAGVDLDQALDILTLRGRLRIANDADLAPFMEREDA